MKKLIIVTLILAAAYTGMKVLKFEPWADQKSRVAIFEPWTNLEGKTVQLKLIQTRLVDGELLGVFEMENGKIVEVPSSKFNEISANKIKELAPTQSVFDEHLSRKLVKLETNELKPIKGVQIPNKYYIFYYTASWCPPCQKFTPSLVQFYDKYKNSEFEIILVSSDTSVADMNMYARSKKMPWPHLQLTSVDSFRQAFPTGLNGIPAIMVTDLEGNIIKKGNAFEVFPKLKKILSI